MKRALPDAGTVKAAIDTVFDEASASGGRPTVTAIERRLGIPHATFHRHYADLIDTHFRPPGSLWPATRRARTGR
ncbi:hypothetical protein EJC51_46280 [Streptomyces aquilus]|uniref:TetR family transcriptional regulator n=1 Tax=Streptomyces aquilus TaxID=2548456 RepID=A0A3S9IEL3_9ACTN|nr:hypothetical protein [Streptomyces aquilus]AZP22806.1 hypothetical protein EJC51_46280 [Streptomyces aquilus]